MRTPLYSILLLLPTIFCDVCPWGYSKMEGGDCFVVKTFYNSFATQYTPKTFDEAEIECNKDGGGLLTSIHSEKENKFIVNQPCEQMWKNIGLKCKGSDCKWDDGSPMDYQRFLGDGPKDDGRSRCYGINGGSYANASWEERDCGKEISDCWVCRAKAQTIYCDEGETEYDGGCLSVYSPPLDQKTTEPTCPEGSRLISIHSSTEDNFYLNVALKAGFNGSIFIGGRFSNGIFQWNDTSIANYHPWAYGFPNTIVGLCSQMLLDSELGTQGQWTNVFCGTNQPVFCIRDWGTAITVIPSPKADAKCPRLQYYAEQGSIYSPNYPLSIPGQQTCEYVIGTIDIWKIGVTFLNYDCQLGTTLALFDGLDSKEPFLTFTSDTPVLNQQYVSSSNVMKIVFSTNDTTVGTGWELEYAPIE